MGLQFHHHHHHQTSEPNSMKLKSRPKGQHSNNNNKFVGVRQRPSGRWVSEIKDTTQKIRMWLGTFETAEEAARAYDEVACLLRGSNTRTNFLTRPSVQNSALSSRIRALLHHKKLKRNVTTSTTNKSYSNFSISISSSSSTSTTSYGTGPTNCNLGTKQGPESVSVNSNQNPWEFDSAFDQLPPLDGFEFSKPGFLLETVADRQVQVSSLSIYTMNGVQE